MTSFILLTREKYWLEFLESELAVAGHALKREWEKG